MSPATFNAAHYAVQKYKALKTIEKESERAQVTESDLEIRKRAVRVARDLFESAMEELCTAVSKD